MSKVEIANIVKKITELSKRDKALFTKILGQITEGGGGSSPSDSIKVTPQELTEAQQMQARKNQDLYYEEEGIGDKTLNCDSSNPPEDWKDTAFGLVDTQVATSILYVKISDDIPDINKWGDIINSYKELIEEPVFIQGNGYYAIKDQYDEIVIIVIQNEGDVEVEGIGTAHESGIYIKSSIETDRTTDRNSWNFVGFYIESITYEGLTTLINQIPSKYISDDSKFASFEITIGFSDFQDAVEGGSEVTLNVPFADILDAADAGKILILNIVNGSDYTFSKNPLKIIGTNYGRVAGDYASPYGAPCFVFPFIKTEMDGQGKPTNFGQTYIAIYEGENEHGLITQLKFLMG